MHEKPKKLLCVLVIITLLAGLLAAGLWFAAARDSLPKCTVEGVITRIDRPSGQEVCGILVEQAGALYHIPIWSDTRLYGKWGQPVSKDTFKTGQRVRAEVENAVNSQTADVEEFCGQVFSIRILSDD